MILSPVPWYDVVDINDKHRHLEVVVEATTRREVAEFLKKNGLRCEVIKEQGEEIYRGICETTIATRKD